MAAVPRDAEPAPESAVCGALGCRETDGLVRVERDAKTRVLCTGHAQDWIEDW